MYISKADMGEFRRMTTNVDGEDKRLLNRIVNGINTMQRDIALLNTENAKLKGE